jgi:hypothetical protein
MGYRYNEKYLESHKNIVFKVLLREIHQLFLLKRTQLIRFWGSRQKLKIITKTNQQLYLILVTATAAAFETLGNFLASGAAVVTHGPT